MWSGDVVLRHLRLRPGALDGLALPVVVAAGLCGTLTLRVPWKRLGRCARARASRGSCGWLRLHAAAI